MSFTKAPISAVITDAIGNTINLGNASGAFTAAPTSIVLTDANGNTLNVGPGVVAKFDATAQAANVGSQTLYAVPAGSAGTYRVTVYIVITQAATTSSTLPNVVIGWTDADSNTPNNFSFTSTNATNTLGAFGGLTTNTPFEGMNVKAGTNITVSTANYASSGATPMQYAVHVKVQYLGA